MIALNKSGILVLIAAGFVPLFLLFDAALGSEKRDKEVKLPGQIGLEETKDIAQRWQAAWRDLADSDASKALSAMRQFAARPEAAVAWFAERLQPAPRPDITALLRWIADLESEQFSRREQARRGLEQHLDDALPLLLKSAREERSVEFKRRIAALLPKAMEPVNGPDHLRILRVLEVVEEIPLPSAGKLLGRLAGGSPNHRLTREAARSLQRWHLLREFRQKKDWPRLELPTEPIAVWGDASFRNRGKVYRAEISKDGKTLATIALRWSDVSLWRVADGKLIKRHREDWAGYVNLTFTRNQRQFLAWDGDRVIRFDAATGEKTIQRVKSPPLKKEPFLRGIFHLTPDGRFLVVGQYRENLTPAKESVLLLWDLEEGKILWQLSRPYCHCLPSLTSDAKRILAYWDSDFQEIVDLTSGKTTGKLDLPGKDGLRSFLSPNGTYPGLFS